MLIVPEIKIFKQTSFFIIKCIVPLSTDTLNAIKTSFLNPAGINVIFLFLLYCVKYKLIMQ